MGSTLIASIEPIFRQVPRLVSGNLAYRSLTPKISGDSIRVTQV